LQHDQDQGRNEQGDDRDENEHAIVSFANRALAQD
jgi:hypothetical protein